MLIEAARAKIVSSGLPPMITVRAADILLQMSSARAMPAAHLERFDSAAQRLIESAADAETLVKSLVLSRDSVRDLVHSVDKFKHSSGAGMQIQSPLDVFERNASQVAETADRYDFPIDRPVLFFADLFYKTGHYSSMLEKVFGTGWFMKRQTRFQDLDVVEIIRGLDRKVVAGTSDEVPYRSTVWINGLFSDDYLRHEMNLMKLFVHEERHVSNNYLRRSAFLLQDISDGFKTFRAQDTGLPSDRTRANIIGEIDANLEEIRFFLEECGPHPDEAAIQKTECQLEKVMQWTELVRTEIDPFRPMDPYEPLDPPLDGLLMQLESDAEALSAELQALKSRP